MPVHGQCRLCLNDSTLQDSHFIPKGAYRLVRGKARNPHPIALEAHRAVRTSAQMKAHLLCWNCEQRLHKNGENAFFRYCYRGPGSFKLLQVLKTLKPLVDKEQFTVYALPESERAAIEEVGYLGVSVLWKSAAHNWKDRDHIVPSINLGPLYQEQLRQFLLGTAPFPEHAALVIEVSDENNRLISAVGSPSTAKPATNHLHWIDLCGIHFNLFVGRLMPIQIKDLCALRHGQKYVLLAKHQEAMMARTYRKHLSVLSRYRSS